MEMKNSKLVGIENVDIDFGYPTNNPSRKTRESGKTQNNLNRKTR